MAARESIRGGSKRSYSQEKNGSTLPRVSIVTAAFGAGNFICNSIESVVTQSYPNIEYIIIDGASDDGTVDVLRRYDRQIDVWISEPDSGIYDAWNKGVHLATGDWIAFLGADDTYLPGAIERYMALAALNPNAEFLATTAQLIHPSGYSPIFGGPWRWPACARALTTINVGTMHRRSLFDRYGTFDTSFRSAADYEFLLRAGSRLETAFSPMTSVMMGAGGASETSANLFERRRAKIQRRVRSRTLATVDLAWDLAKFHVRKFVLAIWGLRRVRSAGAPHA